MDNKNVSLTTINLFGKREVECILHTRLLAEQEIKASCEVELLKVYKDIDAAIKDVAILEVMSEDNGDIVLCVHTKKMERIRYYGTNGHLFRFKYGISPEIIKSAAGLGEQNIVKLTCKELGITQKELSDKLGIDDGTVRKWSSDPTKTPVWAQNFMSLILEHDKNIKAISAFKFFIENIGVGKTNS